MSFEEEYLLDHEVNPLEFEVYPPVLEVYLPNLIEALELDTPEVVSEADFQIHHEETVETSVLDQDLQTHEADVVATVEHTALTVELDVGSEEIVDLTPSILL